MKEFQIINELRKNRKCHQMMKKWPNFYNQKANNETQVKSGSLK
jgi:hypothetical protein